MHMFKTASKKLGLDQAVLAGSRPTGSGSGDRTAPTKAEVRDVSVVRSLMANTMPSFCTSGIFGSKYGVSTIIRQQIIVVSRWKQKMIAGPGIHAYKGDEHCELKQAEWTVNQYDADGRECCIFLFSCLQVCTLEMNPKAWSIRDDI